jgi:hypothetical protein
MRPSDPELETSLGRASGTEPSEASCANSAGVGYPRLRCGVSSLNPFCHLEERSKLCHPPSSD